MPFRPLSILAAALLLPSVGLCQKVRTDWDHGADFTKYKTYRLVKIADNPDVSQLADHFIRDASEVVKVGQKVHVTVVEVDLKRNRIALSMKSKVDLDNRRSDSGDRDTRPGGNRNNAPRQGGSANFNPGAAQNNDWFSQALQNAKKK